MFYIFQAGYNYDPCTGALWNVINRERKVFKKSDTYLCTNSIVSLWFSFTDSAVVIGGYCS